MPSYLDRLDWDKLKSFYVVAVNQSFTKASLQMNITQPALSRQIAIIEHQLNSQLFIRGSEKLFLTPKGRILFESVSQMIEQTKMARTLIDEEDQKPRGNLVIGTTHAFANMWLVDHVPEFLKLYPEISLSVVTQDDLQSLYNKHCDILIGIEPLPEPHFIHEKVMGAPLGLYASADYLKEFGEPKTVQDLDHHRLLSFGDRIDHPYNMANWFLRLGCKHGQVRKPFIDFSSFHGMFQLAKAGVGIITTMNNNPNVQKLKLVRVLPDMSGPSINTYCNFSKALENSKRVRVFVDFLKGVYAHDK